MHIAICNDQIADRKHLERLFGKDMMKEHLKDGMFVDSYGSTDTLLHKAMIYDVFFIDLCETPGLSNESVAKQLREVGVQAPIYLCASSLEDCVPEPSDSIFHLQKPFRMEDLYFCMEIAAAYKASKPALIELREETQTLYIPEEELLYIEGNKSFIHAHLKDGQVLNCCNSCANLWSELKELNNFCYPASRLIINLSHVESTHFGSVMMSDGKRLKISPFFMPHIKKWFLKKEEE